MSFVEILVYLLTGGLHAASLPVFDELQVIEAPNGYSCDAERTVCESVHL